MGKRSGFDLMQLLEMISPWVVVGALTLACLLTCASLAIFGLGRARQPARNQSTAIVTVIAAPTFTPGEATATATPGEVGTTPSGAIAKGVRVKVSGTAGNGLRLRDQPSLNGKVLLLGNETEVFQVEDGPVVMDGYTWWYLVSPFEPERKGWGVADYLVFESGN
jgi:hypothetical protein